MKAAEPDIVVANFMDSSLHALAAKGNLSTVGETYNPNKAYRKVIHFTPHEKDLAFSGHFGDYRIELVSYRYYSINPIFFIAALGRVVRALRRFRATIVRGRLPYLGSLLGCIGAKLLGLPVVVSLGGDNRISQAMEGRYNFNSRMISFGMEALVLRLCDRIIVPNRFTLDYVARIIGARRATAKGVVIPWQIERIPAQPADDIATLARVGLPSDAALVPIIGFLNRYKFTDKLYDALEGWRPAPARPFAFVFCGDGPLRLEGERRFAGRADIRFLGWQERPVIHALLRQAAFVLVPMSGFVLLEAASLGKPVITSRVEWHAELVEHGRSGMLVEPSEPLEWRRAIETLLGDPDAAASLGGALKARFERDYAPEQAKQRELALYRQLLAERARESAAVALGR
ncbi:MAG TPA: glycosyltransferase family 4 protein [Alphaproteobacteria bacterium]|nr:glycosyltransferase family 4 protein [Alphaproteobacteria bacterium]